MKFVLGVCCDDLMQLSYLSIFVTKPIAVVGTEESLALDKYIISVMSACHVSKDSKAIYPWQYEFFLLSVFQFLDTEELTKSVNKSWNNFVKTKSLAWKYISVLSPNYLKLYPCNSIKFCGPIFQHHINFNLEDINSIIVFGSRHCNLLPYLFSVISGIKNLKVLKIYHPQEMKFPKFTYSLIELELHLTHRFTIHKNFYENLKLCNPALEKLHLHGFNVDKIMFHHIKRFTQIKRLRFSNCLISDPDSFIFTPHLESFAIVHCSLRERSEVVFQALQLSQLKEFMFIKNYDLQNKSLAIASETLISVFSKRKGSDDNDFQLIVDTNIFDSFAIGSNRRKIKSAIAKCTFYTFQIANMDNMYKSQNTKCLWITPRHRLWVLLTQKQT